MVIRYIKVQLHIFKFIIYAIQKLFLKTKKTINQLINKNNNSNKSSKTDLNPLSANFTKWSNTPKQFVDCCRRFV